MVRAPPPIHERLLLRNTFFTSGTERDSLYDANLGPSRDSLTLTLAQSRADSCAVPARATENRARTAVCVGKAAIC